MEEWKTIKEKPNYSISNCGRVRNDKTQRILKISTRKDGYQQVMLGRKTTPLYIHRLVANAFLENTENKTAVDHIDGNKSNNNIENLRWVTYSENMYGYGYKQRNENKKKKILATNGIEKIVFDSRDETAKYFNCHKSQIEYGRIYKKGNKKGWKFEIVKDIV